VRTQDADTLVVGAGAAGLAAAHELRARGREVLVLDAGDRPGGVMRSEIRGGFLFECGPNTFQLKAPALRLLRRAGLEAALVKASPASRKRFLLRGDRLVPVPLGPGALLGTSLLSGRAKLRLLAEPFIRRGDAREESVADFVARRLGPEVVDALVGPFLTGVYAGDERVLGAEAVFPALVAWERESGSLAGGALREMLRRGERGAPGSWSAAKGLGPLARLLADGLGEAVCLGTRVRAVAREAWGWTVSLDGSELRARTLLIAADAAGAAELLASLDAESAAFLRAVDYAPIASVALPVDPTRASRPVDGFGFLVPRDSGLDLLGALFMSRLFARRAPIDRVLVTAMIGGARWRGIVDAADDEILARVAQGLERGLGLRELPDPLAITRWARAVAQPGPDHLPRVRALRARLEAPGQLALAGSYLDGVGLADSFASGMAAAARLCAG